MLARATELGLPVPAGALTPTEIDAAWQDGAAAVKVFPISTAGGMRYLRAVRDALPDIPLVPTGGIGVDEAARYLAAGATAVALADALLGDAAQQGGDLAALGRRARRVVAAATTVGQKP